jgi:hypothetical protein
MVKRAASKKLKEKIYNLKFSDTPKERKFNSKEFESKARKIRKSFKDEDLVRFRTTG